MSEQANPERWAIIQVFFNQTLRTQEVLKEFMYTDSYQEIGKKLYISESTVSQYITKVCKQLKSFDVFAEGISAKEMSQELKRLLKLYIFDIASEQFDRFLSGIEENKSTFYQEKKGKIMIILQVNPLQVNFTFIVKILKKIQSFFGKEHIQIRIEEGSIKLTITGSIEGCQRLKDRFDAGELIDILGIPVTDVSSVEVITENNLWTNLRTWVQSNIVPDWDLEEIVGGTIAALRANPDFDATPALGSVMGINNEEESTSISELLSSLNNEDVNQVRLAAQKLGEIEVSTPEVINSLKEKLNTIEDVQTQWQIALSLGKIAPEEHPKAKAQKQTIELGNTSLELIVATKNDEDDFVDILVEIRPDWDDCLPLGLEAKILEESGEDFWQDEFVSTQLVTEEQPYIYFSFWGTPGDRFTLQLSLENTMLPKNFQI
jgi:predicted DNA-binding protein YlxM (UPF0122 family)